MYSPLTRVYSFLPESGSYVLYNDNIIDKAIPATIREVYGATSEYGGVDQNRIIDKSISPSLYTDSTYGTKRDESFYYSNTFSYYGNLPYFYCIVSPAGGAGKNHAIYFSMSNDGVFGQEVLIASGSMTRDGYPDEGLATNWWGYSSSCHFNTSLIPNKSEKMENLCYKIRIVCDQPVINIYGVPLANGLHFFNCNLHLIASY
jgi:hypothetical protein